MFLSRSTSVPFALLLTLFALAPNSPPAHSSKGQYVHISDLHFNPFYDRSQFEQLNSRPVEDWASILEKSQPPGFNLKRQDSNYALIKSSLDDASRRVPAPDFLLVTGDFLAHDWEKMYDQAARKSHRTDPQPYLAFTSKAIRFLAGEFRQRFPMASIVPTLGNNDSDCGNYAITPQGPFLKMFAAAWAPLIGQGGDQDAFQAMFSRGGYFSLKLPHVKDHRVIILNSVFFSVSYANACGTGDNRKPSMDELDWLATTLAQARAARETVWLVMHIPPGINSFATARSVQKNGPAVTLWQPEWTDRFLQLVERYQGTIQATLGGHMHMDDFRVIRLHGKPVLFCKLAPAISPIYGNNPGYQIGQYDRQTGAIANYQTYFLANLAKDGVPRESVAGSWELEYDFGATYGSSGLNSQSIARIADDLRTKAMVQRDYIRFYSVSAAPEMTAQTIDIYRCAILSTTAQEFEACYRGGAEPHR